MVELSLDGLSELNDSMNELQYWVTMVIYILMGIVVFIVLYSLYKILSCGVCLMKCITCPCRCLFKKNTKEEKRNLLEYSPAPKPTSLV